MFLPIIWMICLISSLILGKTPSLSVSTSQFEVLILDVRLMKSKDFLYLSLLMV